LLTRENLLAKLREPRTHVGVGKRLDDRTVQSGNDSLGCTFWRPTRVPDREVKSGQPRFVRSRNFGRSGRPASARNRKDLDLTIAGSM
jgi:hypothetical protein